jgi:hypothetical protein
MAGMHHLQIAGVEIDSRIRSSTPEGADTEGPDELAEPTC